jgi:glutamate synthase domain-containing protein 1
MCGIVGLYLKNGGLEPKLGEFLSAMLIEMTERGPDSSGVAFYRRPAKEGYGKITLYNKDHNYDWKGLVADAQAALGDVDDPEQVDNHCIVVAKATPSKFLVWLRETRPEIRVVGVGTTIEVFKEIGSPRDVVARFDIRKFGGTHALGHTRMATESLVTTEHSHPFSMGDDFCLVHNGSLSNHNRLRRWLRQQGVQFQTDNDSEVAAGYFTYQMSQGATLKEALEAGLKELDGFYTFAVGTRDGFAVVRDPIACQPAVMAETDDWVAMASEFRSIAQLPGVEMATIWEPAPATVYAWGSV